MMFVFKCFVADVTDERSHARVFVFVSCKRTLFTKSFIAHVTGVHFALNVILPRFAFSWQIIFHQLTADRRRLIVREETRFRWTIISCTIRTEGFVLERKKTSNGEISACATHFDPFLFGVEPMVFVIKCDIGSAMEMSSDGLFTGFVMRFFYC